ncbi:hypothetical protein GQ44DRAFT_774495 [Phaeosphaeriaceae sp. PMI808]|nr:hypothetical protein GQ44DRAFT_774495 [Phaeosphaeriaceae sp. PMI808]
MPYQQISKVKEEHLIFVKNVPGYMAKSVIPDLYEEYEPLRVKNVYPDGNITTVVVAFQSYEEARYAQQATDGMFLEDVVLRVEMYSKHLSVRFLREGRNTKQVKNLKVRTKEVDVEDWSWEDSIDPGEPVKEQENEPGNPQKQAAGTWAEVAKKARQPGIRIFPASIISPSQKHVSAVKEVDEVTVIPSTVRASSASTADNASSEITETRRTSSDIPITLSSNSSGSEKDIAANSRSPTAIRPTMVSREISAAWEPIDSTERIRQRHCADCSFCKMRMRRYK